MKIENLTGIKDDMVMEAPLIEAVLPEFLEFCKDCVLVAHNASFDVGFIKAKAEQLNREHGMELQTDFSNPLIPKHFSKYITPNTHKVN